MARIKNCRNIPRSRSMKRHSGGKKRLSKGAPKRRSVEIPKSGVMEVSTATEEPVLEVPKNNVEKGKAAQETSRKSLPNNDTIDLIASDDENAVKSPDTPTQTKSRKRKSKNSSVVIDVCENSINDDIIIDHVIPSKEIQVLEIQNNNSIVDITKDEDVQLMGKENDEIVILHANCKKVTEIEIIGQIQKIPSPTPILSPSQSAHGIHKWKEKKKVMKSSNIALNTTTNSRQEKDHFNAPAYKNHKRKSGGFVNKKNIENRNKKRFKSNQDLFFEGLNPKSKIAAIGGNVYSENPVAIPTFGLRPIIIDGSNVAYHHSRNRHFSCRGLEICINYFKEKGHKVTAFVPHFRVKSNMSDNPKLLEKLEKQGDVILTPSREIDGVAITSYDDRYIVQFAAVKGGVIVTRDNYRDLLGENPAWEDTIKYRLLQFTWADDLLMFPNDPLGPRGPNLEKFLRFS